VVERGIGRGLAAILPAGREEQEALHELAVELIRPNPRQPRKRFDEESVRGLADSIKAHGLLQPLLVRPLAGSGYELIVRASADRERLELALVENMAREDLNAVEAAEACAALVDELGLTQEEVGRRVGKSRVAITNLIRLLDLPDDVLRSIAAAELTEGHGRALLQVSDAKTQSVLARQARAKKLSVRQTEALARKSATAKPSREGRLKAVPSADAEAARQHAEDALAGALGCDVEVRIARRGARVEIAFDDLHEIEELASRIRSRLAA
jgi:ParB family chromosome partitioning protein